MTPRSKLDAAAIENGLATLDHWELRDGKLHRDFAFSDFRRAFAFMTAAADIAEEMNHHPEWSNVYNRVAVDLVTHDAAGITELDFSLARAMNRLAG